MIFAPLVRIITIASVLAVISQREVNASEKQTSCREISLSSAGTILFTSSRVLAVAPGAGGRRGVANYVLIAPSTGDAEQNLADVLEIVVMADVRETRKPECVANTAAGSSTVSCALSLFGAKLKLIVKYEPKTTAVNAAFYQERTILIAADVTENVLTCPRSRIKGKGGQSDFHELAEGVLPFSLPLARTR